MMTDQFNLNKPGEYILVGGRYPVTIRFCLFEWYYVLSLLSFFYFDSLFPSSSTILCIRCWDVFGSSSRPPWLDTHPLWPSYANKVFFATVLCRRGKIVWKTNKKIQKFSFHASQSSHKTTTTTAKKKNGKWKMKYLVSIALGSLVAHNSRASYFYSR